MESVETMIALMDEYKTFQDALDRARPDLLIRLKHKDGSADVFRPKKYWALLVRAMKIKVTMVSEERFRMEVHERTGEVWAARVVQTVYRAELGDASALGDGACSEEERIVRTFHNIRSRAHTRGWIRAVANLVAFGEAQLPDDQSDAPGPDEY